MIIVTGSNGFIGSNLITQLNKLGENNILAVDDHSNKDLESNTKDCNISERVNIQEFLNMVVTGELQSRKINAIFHQGACSDTMEWDVDYILENNFNYSKILLDFSESNNIPFIYASSASVYGAGKVFAENKNNETPINLYAYSKYLFDQVVRNRLLKSNSQIVGMRYFNVYGPNETHKGRMASVAYHLHQQLKKGNEVRLFEGSDGYGNGEQRRDFIHVNDIVKVNLWFYKNSDVSGIFNVGTGKSQTFKEVADAVIEWNEKGSVKYIPFPEKLKGSYQSFTEADISKLRSSGYEETFMDVATGVKQYLNVLESSWPKNES
jgi:ADP-L-glycero-D-manno-heptose 6-epimerase